MFGSWLYVCVCMCVCIYQSQNRKGREILPSLSYHSNENNRQMEDDILKSVTYGGHWRLPAPEKYCASEILSCYFFCIFQLFRLISDILGFFLPQITPDTANHVTFFVICTDFYTLIWGARGGSKVHTGFQRNFGVFTVNDWKLHTSPCWLRSPGEMFH